MTRQFKIIVDIHLNGYVAYSLGLKGVVVGQGDTYEEALASMLKWCAGGDGEIVVPPGTFEARM